MNEAEYREVVAMAIQNEIDAKTFYEEASRRVDDDYLKQMFAEFAVEEGKHRTILENIQASKSLGAYFRQETDYKVAETVDKPALSFDMKPADAVALAMKNEEEAMVQYTRMADDCEDPDKKAIFLDLAAMERGHKNRMEQAFVDIGFPEVW